MNLTPDQLEHLCQVMHDAYEAAATDEGWETQETSRKPWDDVPDANKATLHAAVQALADAVDPLVMPAAIATVRRALRVGHASFVQQLSRRSDERTAGYNDALLTERNCLDYQLGKCSNE